MQKTLLIEAKRNEEGAPIIKVLDYDTKGDNLSFFYKHLECDCIDIVRAYAISENPALKDICLVVDDEGLFKEKPTVNTLASLLYGVLEHGQPIVGNVLVCKDFHTPDGTETVGLTDGDIIALDLVLRKLVKKYNDRVKQN